MICREDGSRTEFYPSMDQYRQAIKNDKGIGYLKSFFFSSFYSS
jgi:hypothetical protein